MHEQLFSINAKVAALCQPAAYPEHPQMVEVIETHMSWVFLTERHVYKLKKPVCHVHLDFRKLEARQVYCLEELRLNRRLTEAIYMDVIALKMDSNGALHLGGDGVVVEWLVKMHRLPAHLMLDRMLQEGTACTEHLRRVARRLCDFYQTRSRADINPTQYIHRFRRDIDAYEHELCNPALGLDDTVVRQLCQQQRQLLERCTDMLMARVKAGHIVEGHGDLRPEHICLGEPLAIIDGLEFSNELRTLDTADELGFLALECEALGAPQFGQVLLDAYREEAGEAFDVPHAALIHFYQSYRACVRAKIAIWHLKELRYRDSPQWLARAQRYLHLAAQHMKNSETALRAPASANFQAAA